MKLSTFALLVLLLGGGAYFYLHSNGLRIGAPTGAEPAPLEERLPPTEFPASATPHPAKEAIAEAVRRYPALSQKDSALNRKFVALFGAAKAKEPDTLIKPDWPLVIAARADAELRQSTAPSPADADSIPSPSLPPATARPRGPLVYFAGRVVQKTSAGLLIECEQTLGVRDGHYALEQPFHGQIGLSEIDGDYLLKADPEERSVVDNDFLAGIAEIAPPFSFTTVMGSNRTVRSLRWVDPATVQNHLAGKTSLLHGMQGTMLNRPAHQ
jgi:hypothetical protein